MQPFLEDQDAIPTAPGSPNEAKYKLVAAGTDRAYRLAKQYGVKLVFGTDIQFNPDGAPSSNTSGRPPPTPSAALGSLGRSASGTATRP